MEELMPSFDKQFFLQNQSSIFFSNNFKYQNTCSSFKKGRSPPNFLSTITYWYVKSKVILAEHQVNICQYCTSVLEDTNLAEV